MGDVKENKKKLGLGSQILIGIVIGLALGFISPTLANKLSPIGTIFLRLLKMVMVPLVFFSITSGVCKMGDVKQLASVGLRFVLYILITSGISAAIGVVGVLLTHPGSGTTEFLDSTAKVEKVSYNFIDNVISWVPENVVQSMSEANMLQVIVFAIFLGVALLALGKKVSVFVDMIDQGSEAMLKIVEYIMIVSPIGIASLMATMVTTISGFAKESVIGGTAGTAVITLMTAMRIGVARGVYTNEAGLGSSPIVAAAARTNSCARQGLISMTSVFFTTILTCSMTGLVIISSGLLNNSNMNGSALVTTVYNMSLPHNLGMYLIAVGIIFFSDILDNICIMQIK